MHQRQIRFSGQRDSRIWFHLPAINLRDGSAAGQWCISGVAVGRCPVGTRGPIPQERQVEHPEICGLCIKANIISRMCLWRCWRSFKAAQVPKFQRLMSGTVTTRTAPGPAVLRLRIHSVAPDLLIPATPGTQPRASAASGDRARLLVGSLMMCGWLDA